MDILDILLDILLKPPQPFIGLFFHFLPLCRPIAKSPFSFVRDLQFQTHLEWREERNMVSGGHCLRTGF